jgi:hypothetical protein
MRNKTHKHADIQHKTEHWYREDCMFLMGNVSTYLSQSVYFIRSVQGKDSGKNQALTILRSKVKGMRFGGLIFLRL